MSWKVTQTPTGAVEIFDEFQGGGSLIVCLPDGLITLYEIPMYGGTERKVGDFSTICAAIEASETLT